MSDTMTAEAATALPGDNSAAREEGRKALFKDVGKFAKADGEGRRSLLATYRATVRAAQEGYIDLAPTKTADGKKTDVAHEIYTHYRDNFSKVNPKDDVKAQVSKLRTFVAVGLNPNIDPSQLFERVLEHHAALKQADVPLVPETRALITVFTKQKNAPDAEMSDDQIKDMIQKHKTDKEEADFLKSAMNALEKAHELSGREELEVLVQEIRTLMPQEAAPAP